MKKCRQGFGLWELSFGLVLAALLTGAVTASSRQMTVYVRGQRTLEDMTAILSACRQYDVLYGGWPGSFSDLTEVLPQVKPDNIWGYPFVIASGENRVWIETDVPAGSLRPSLKGNYTVIHTASGTDHVRLSMNRSDGQAARLEYEKRNVYGP